MPFEKLDRRKLLKLSLAGGASALLARAADRATGLPKRKEQSDSSTREYWIQCDSMPHNLIPSGLDQMSGMPYKSTDCSIGAIVYRAFTPNWEAVLPGDSDIGPNTGFPGPVIRAKVGDTIVVHFRNNDTHYKFPHSVHAHGVEYQPGSDGAYIWTQRDSNPGAAVKLGDTFTYQYTALPTSVGTWPYHDHAEMQTLFPGTMPIMELNAELGMMGILAITDDNTVPADVEQVLIMHDLYQSDVPGLSQDFDCFNGQCYLGNTPTFRATVGQRVRWRVMALGKEFHSFHIHGHRWQANTVSIDTQVLGPATSITLDYLEDAPGTWLYHCHVVDHMMGGMMGYYIVD